MKMFDSVIKNNMQEIRRVCRELQDGFICDIHKAKGTYKFARFDPYIFTDEYQRDHMRPI